MSEAGFFGRGRLAFFLSMIAAVLLWVGLSAAAVDRQGASASQRLFRAGIDLLQIDVSVVNRNRQPVRGLTAADFTVRIDGRPQPVVVFKAIDVPTPDRRPAAPWIREVAPDVATNTPPSGRVLAILIDDYSFEDAAIGVGGVVKARQVALAALNELGAQDRAAVLFTGNAHTAQGFTTNQALLRMAIERAPLFSSSMAPGKTGVDYGRESGPEEQGYCTCGLCSIEALVNVARSLRAVPEQRKIVLYVSAGAAVLPKPPSVHSDPLGCQERKRAAVYEALRQAQQANVTIQAVDPKGLDLGRQAVDGPRVFTTLTPNPGQVPQIMLDHPATPRQQFLRTMAESTGGRAVVNNNDMEREVPAVLAESSSYYLLGVERPTAMQDGRFHPIEVRVNRRGVDVRARSGVYGSEMPSINQAPPATNDASDLTAAIAGALPTPSFPMELAVMPVAQGRQAAVVLAIGVMPPAAETRGTGAEVVEVSATLFQPETGRAVQSRHERLTVNWNPTEAAFGFFEVLTRLEAAPGRYELRVAAMAGNRRTASVYADVLVPDFGAELSTSGLLLNVTPSPKTALTAAVDELVPLLPTSRRVFRATDRAIAFLRVYQPRAGVASAAVTARITNAGNEVVFDKDRLESATGAPAGATDYRFDVPVTELSGGEYLLTVQVTAGNQTALRRVRFRIAP